MAVTGYPYENQDTTETQYATLFSELQDPGVIGSAGGAAELAASLPGGLFVRIAAGRAFARGFILDNDADADIDVGPADTSARVDRIAARVNPATNTSTLEHIPGTPGSTTPPPLVRTFTGAYDVPLWRFTVGAGATAATALVDEREWVSHRTRLWRERPTAPRMGQPGFNLVSRRWEGWAGEWVTFPDSRDTPTERVYEAERPYGATGVDLYGTGGEETALVAVTIPASAPAGLYLLMPVLQIDTAPGETANAGTLYVRTDGYAESCRADAVTTTRTISPTFPYMHPGGARSIRLLHKPAPPGVNVVNTGTAIRAAYVGGA